MHGAASCAASTALWAVHAVCFAAVQTANVQSHPDACWHRTLGRLRMPIDALISPHEAPHRTASWVTIYNTNNPKAQTDMTELV